MKNLLIKAIKFYQNRISPVSYPHCRFCPTCSEYTVLSIGKYGAIKGGLLSCWRLLRCNPLGRGGLDLP